MVFCFRYWNETKNDRPGAGGIDRGCARWDRPKPINAVGGRAQQIAAIFDAAENGHGQVLVGGRRFSEPGIVGNGHNRFAAPGDQFLVSSG